MNFGIEWGMPVVIDLFMGGLSAGLFVLSAFLAYLRNEKYNRLAAAGAYISPFPLYIALCMLLIDLEQPFDFWRLYTTIQWTSPMSIGSWLLLAFSIITTLNALMWLPDRYTKFVIIPLPQNREKIRGILGAIGFPIAIGVGIYTGVLLGAVPARPFWNTPMVAMLFLTNALSTGAAVLILVSTWDSKRKTVEDFHSERKILYSADVILLLFAVFLVIPYILHNSLSTASQADSLKMILGGEFTGLFWIGFVVVGLLVPLLMETLDLIPEIARSRKPYHIKTFGYVSAILVLVGGFILRYVFVYAGQLTHFGVD
jgi:polysulfide reductase chain C